VSLGSRFSALFAPQQATGPVPFGFKIGWIAVKSVDTAKLVSSFNVRSPRSATWQEGIDTAYKKSDLAYFTPPVDRWVCIVGEWALGQGDRVSVQSIAKRIVELRSMFGEAHAYATHRVIEYHHWMVAKEGLLLRRFAYLGESGEVLANDGPLTAAERKLRFFNLPREQWQPNEADVMAVASAWSFDPTLLSPQSGPGKFGVLARIL
jgi:hypothetical protein